MKSILISIQPKWCELIASGQKTIEIRKTRPICQTPFKVYIYCTKDEPLYHSGEKFYMKEANEFGNGKVIGEFVCDAILPMSIWYSNPNDRLSQREYPFTCLTDKEIMGYLGNGVEGYGWHISDLVIYDKPKELSDFIIPSKIGCCNEGNCRGCRWFDRGNGFNVEDDCNAPFCTDEYKPLRKAPQSWCYVEEVRNG